MGFSMASHLVKAGYSVWGMDLNSHKIDALTSLGGKGSVTEDVLRKADVVIFMVVNGKQCQTILQEQLLSKLSSTCTLCVMSTCSLEDIQLLNQLAISAGHAFIDAPVSGGTVGAGNASLTIMASGVESAYTKMMPIFNTLGSRVFRVGNEIGNGTSLKIVNQLLCGVHIVAAAEAFALAEKAGIDLELVLDVLGQSSAASWMLNDRGPRMQKKHPDVSSAIDIFVKDLGLVLNAGTKTKAALPLTAAAYQMFLASSARGDGSADDSQVITSYRLLNQAS